MAERKATNKYYPPDWDPSKGSINRHKKSHPLRDRARKLDEGILVVRFEMPFNIWCLKCNNHIGMGVRYNAEKSRAGSYYTSPIYKFKMKCHLCDNYFEIQTDPSKFDYVILSGARKQSRLPASDEAAVEVNEEDETKKKMTDAMSRLERKVEDRIQGNAQLPSLQELKNWRLRWKDNFSSNQLIRSQYRERRKMIEKNKEQNKRLQMKTSLKIAIASPLPEDRLVAKEILHKSRAGRLEDLEKSRKRELLASAALSSKQKTETITKSDSVPSVSTRLVKIKKEPG